MFSPGTDFNDKHIEGVERIVNGFEMNHLPWQAALARKYDGKVVCGGSLINHRYVM